MIGNVGFAPKAVGFGKFISNSYEPSKTKFREFCEEQDEIKAYERMNAEGDKDEFAPGEFLATATNENPPNMYYVQYIRNVKDGNGEPTAHNFRIYKDKAQPPQGSIGDNKEKIGSITEWLNEVKKVEGL